MKVLFLSAWYPHRYDKMFGLFVQKHAEAVNLYADVKVLYVHPDENITDFEIVEQKHNDLNEIIVYYPIKSKSIFHKLTKSIRYFNAYRKGFKHILQKEFKPDIIQANVFTRTALMGYYFKIIYKIPYAVIEHWTRYHRDNTFTNIIHKKLTIFAAKKASAILPVTYHLQKSMEFHGLKNDNYHVINNVVDDIFFENLEHAPANLKKRILNVTCFDDDHKNLSGLLRTIHKLYQQRQDFEIYLIGDGDDFEKIRSLSKELELEGSAVFFTGVLEGKKLVEMYQSCQITVLFSNFENIPVVISESFACGRPVISTNVGGISEHINDDNGLLIDRGDEVALLDSLNYMLDNYQNYDHSKIQKEAVKKYSPVEVGKNLTDIYFNILNS